ncbi:ComF family protein [Parahaliea sp. F7430]|uniref:ComF family protein n=2 Tax=Sediminihaliea albiluteola TaxID=2758564 RepID=A0A7W2YJV2_9GAMM|nr:ComF family protein [Sediminihaliea albiluteola]
MLNSHCQPISIAMVNSWRQMLLDGLFPQCCLFCGLQCRKEPLCSACRGELQLNKDCCSRCALPLASINQQHDSLGPRYCGHCLRSSPHFDAVLAPYLYDEQFALLIQRWKYQPDPKLAKLMAALWLYAAPAELPAVDLLLPVPLHWRKLLQRGFNQALQLCQELQQHHPALRSTKLASRWCRRQRSTLAQAGLNAKARQGNLAGAFTLSRGCDNLRIAIVDDVMTTGATANALARCLKEAGAHTVQLWCLARTPAPPD